MKCMGLSHLGSVVNEIQYDGLHRRIVKEVKNSADLDMTYHYYYNNQSMVEIHNGSEQVIQQFVWGSQYIDELVEIGVNDDPADGSENDCESFYYPQHNANYNIIGLTDASGNLVERYEYTPYGQRQVFKVAGINDPDASAPSHLSTRTEIAGVHQPYAINAFGHQGLLHDEATGLVYNRARMLNTRLQRFNQRDPLGYPDGMNVYAGYHIMFGGVDPSGLDFIAVADRAVHGTLKAARHYSIQVWQCGCAFVPLNHSEGFSEEEIRNKCSVGTTIVPQKLASTELLARTGYKVWALEPAKPPISIWSSSDIAGFRRVILNVWISEVVFSDTSDRIMPIVDGTPTEIQTLWETIRQNADDYPWAEHNDGKVITNFENWPRSMYKSFQSNSNTFVREMIRQAGLTMVEMEGRHPGEQSASQNRVPIYETRTRGYTYVVDHFIFLSRDTPWHSSQPPRQWQ